METLYTKKIYYKKYDHRLVVKTKDYRVGEDKQTPTVEVIQWLMAKRFPDTSWRTSTSYSYITKSSHYAVFFKGPEAYEYLREQIGEKYIIAYERPMNEEHTALLEGNDKLVTRKQLFYGKYRMCLRVSPERISAWQTSSSNIRKIKEWCVEQFGDERENADRYMISGYSKGNFYFATPSDALLFKLTWGGQDVKTERVVLVSELEGANA